MDVFTNNIWCSYHHVGYKMRRTVAVSALEASAGRIQDHYY